MRGRRRRGGGLGGVEVDGKREMGWSGCARELNAHMCVGGDSSGTRSWALFSRFPRPRIEFHSFFSGRQRGQLAVCYLRADIHDQTWLGYLSIRFVFPTVSSTPLSSFIFTTLSTFLLSRPLKYHRQRRHHALSSSSHLPVLLGWALPCSLLELYRVLHEQRSCPAPLGRQVWYGIHSARRLAEVQGTD